MADVPCCTMGNSWCHWNRSPKCFAHVCKCSMWGICRSINVNHAVDRNLFGIYIWGISRYFRYFEIFRDISRHFMIISSLKNAALPAPSASTVNGPSTDRGQGHRLLPMRRRRARVRLQDHLVAWRRRKWSSGYPLGMSKPKEKNRKMDNLWLIYG